MQAWASGRPALTTLNLCDCAKITVEGCHSFLVALSRGTQLVAMEVPKREVRQNGKRMLSFGWEIRSSMPSCKILKTQ